MSQMVTTGCVNVVCKRICNDLEVGVECKNSITATAVNVNDIAVDVNHILYDGHIEATKVSKELNVTFGIVCAIKEGYAVLYASDGKLITIDNNYLIVKDER